MEFITHSCYFLVFSLAHYDIVVTTYQLVMKEAFPGGKEKIDKSNKDDVPKVSIYYKYKFKCTHALTLSIFRCDLRFRFDNLYMKVYLVITILKS